MSIAFDDADVSDLRQEPAPGKKRGRGRRSNASIKSEIQDQFQALLQMFTMVWATRDDVCPVVLNNQAPLIAADLADFAAKSEWAKKYLTKTLEIGKVIPFMMHVMPVMQAINAHHIAPHMQDGEATPDAGQGFVG